MSRSRFFANNLPDYAQGSKVSIDPHYWVPKVKSVIDSVVKGMPPKPQNCDGSLYVGCAGVGYMLHYVSGISLFEDMKSQYTKIASEYAEVSLGYCKSKHCRDPPPAFLLGPAGIYALSGLVYSDIGNEQARVDCIKTYLALASQCEPMDYLGCGSDELLVGRAGYISGALLLNRKFGEVMAKDKLYKLCEAILQAGKKYSQRHKSPSPLMYSYYQTEYLGAAHGLSGILQMLLSVPGFVKSNSEIEMTVRASVDFMLGLQQPNGNIAPALDEVQGGYRRPESEELVHWCHGGPGVVYLFAKAYLFWNDEKYLQACLKCGELTWQKGLLKKGPGICHGVAGSGYVFLLLYRLTSNEKYLHRAVKFAEFLFCEEFQRGSRTPDTPFSLYEGLAGTACFLADLMQPQKAEFPMFDVFSSGQ